MRITVKKFNDMHAHLRDRTMITPCILPIQDNCMLYFVLVECMEGYDHVLIMPNTTDPILNATLVRAYRQDIKDVWSSAPEVSEFRPLMTMQITEQTTPAMIYEAREVVTAGKVYPRGMTTNSENGVLDYTLLRPIFAAMEDVDMPVCLHGEKPGEFCLDRELRFLGILADIIERYPKLRIVLEHITTRTAVEFIKRAPANVAATITAHHLLLTLDDVIGGHLHPHNFCKPVAKRYEDREALREVVLSGHPRFFFGSDSAPWPRGRKECADGCAGIFSAPSAPALICEFLQGDVQKINRFANEFAAAFYRLPPTEEYITLERWDGSPETAPQVTLNGPVEIFTGNDKGILPWCILSEE